MFKYQNDTIQSNETSTDFKTLQEIDVPRIKKTLIPVYSFSTDISGSFIMTNDEKFCGGNCLNFIEEHFDIKWAQVEFDIYFNKIFTYQKATLCSPDDFTSPEMKHAISIGILMLCPPTSNLVMSE